MKKVIAILLCMGVIMSFAGCDSSIVEELNPFEQITSEKESKYEVLDQEGYIVPNCYVTIWDLELYPQALQKDILRFRIQCIIGLRIFYFHFRVWQYEDKIIFAAC